MSLAERRRQGGVESSMESLSLNQAKLTPKTNVGKKTAVADSWEDEDASSSGEDTETEGPSIRNAMPGPPPPTPVTPGYNPSQTGVEFEDPYAVKGSPSSGGRGDKRRPEKQTATANRLIAGALGVRAPKRTEEQRAYDRAIREKEQKRLDKEKEEQKKAEEEKQKAKDAVWDD